MKGYTTSNNHTYSGNTVSLAATDMGSYSGTSLVKDAQITVVAKNCNGTGSLTHSSKYIYDPKTLALITTIAGPRLTESYISCWWRRNWKCECWCCKNECS